MNKDISHQKKVKSMLLTDLLCQKRRRGRRGEEETKIKKKNNIKHGSQYL